MTDQPAAGAADAGGALVTNKWAVAATETRSAAKWIIASLAAAAAAIFGAGPIISRPELSWQTDWPQLLLAAAFGAVSMICLILLIGMVGSILAPEKITLATMPPEVIKELEDTAAVRFPHGILTFQQFLDRARDASQLAVQLPHEIRRLEREVPASEFPAVKAQIEEMLAVARENLEVYRTAAQGYLDEAAYTRVNRTFIGNKRNVAILAIAAAVGALGFQLSLASKKESPAAAPASTAPTLSYLIKLPAVESGALWDALGLGPCTNGQGEVPVLKQKGTGSPADPFVVTTITTGPACPVQTFSVVSDVFALREPQPDKIIVEYVPTKGSTTTQPTTRLPRSTR